MKLNLPGPEFIYESVIEKKHIDFIGHVNNSKYLELYEDARWSIIAPQGYDRFNPASMEIVPIITEVHVRYRKELILGEEFKVVTRLLNKKSSVIIQIEQKILKMNGLLSSDAIFDMGMFNSITRKICSPSDRFLVAMGVL